MSIECGYCEHDLRGPHDKDCPRFDPRPCICDPEWQPNCPRHSGGDAR